MAKQKDDSFNLAQQRYGSAAVAKELSGLSTKANLAQWSERATQNSRIYYGPDHRGGAGTDQRKVRAAPGRRR